MQNLVDHELLSIACHEGNFHQQEVVDFNGHGSSSSSVKYPLLNAISNGHLTIVMWWNLYRY